MLLVIRRNYQDMSSGLIEVLMWFVEYRLIEIEREKTVNMRLNI